MTKEQAIKNLLEIVELSKDEIKSGNTNIAATLDYEDLKSLQIALEMLKEKDDEIEKALELAFQYGQIDGDHHKTWVIDQMVRILTGDKYNEFVKEYEINNILKGKIKNDSRRSNTKTKRICSK